MTYNELRVAIQDSIIAKWTTEHPTIPIYIGTSTKKPDDTFLMLRLDYGDTNLASIGTAVNSLFRTMGIIVFVLICPSNVKNSAYDSYIETLFEIKKDNLISGILLKDFKANNKTFDGDSSQTVITQVFQSDRT
jgi:hypothetical protein